MGVKSDACWRSLVPTQAPGLGQLVVSDLDHIDVMTGRRGDPPASPVHVEEPSVLIDLEVEIDCPQTRMITVKAQTIDADPAVFLTNRHDHPALVRTYRQTPSDELPSLVPCLCELPVLRRRPHGRNILWSFLIPPTQPENATLKIRLSTGGVASLSLLQDPARTVRANQSQR